VALRSVLIVADDLTGAADCAGQFRQAGFPAVVLAHPAGHHFSWPLAQVVSLSLNTRDASPSVVRRIWERQAPAIRALAQNALVYQKIDSTLRGHPALEVRLLLGCLGIASAIVAPAFPKLGRHTREGMHRVDGIPLAETEYGHQRRRSQPTSYLPELLASCDEARPIHLPWQVIDGGVNVVAPWLLQRLDGPGRLITVDVTDERHLDILTQAALPLVGRALLVGSAGWAERLALACQGWLADIPRPGALGVVGSLNAVATRQVEAASRAGVMVVQWTSLAAYGRPRLSQALAAGRSVILWTNPGGARPARGGAGRRLLGAVADGVQQLLATAPVSGLMIVGGDTAAAVLRVLRAAGLVLAGEVATGVPYGRLMNGPFAGLPIITKAGGFGADTALAEGLTFLQQLPVQ
jgi:D-threonate/D-erythronate kinase